VQAAPQWHVSPQVQPPRRVVACAWHPHPQAGAEQDPHEHALVVFVFVI
jgi:hypothetical protein